MQAPKETKEAFRQLIQGELHPGDGLLVIGNAAAAGTGYLLEKERDRLQGRFSGAFLEKTSRRVDECRIPPSLITKYQDRASALLQMGSGGFLSAAWIMAEAFSLGFYADLRKVPLRQETIEICETLDLDPYKLWSEGAYLAGARDAWGLCEAVRDEGWEAAVIGSVTAGPGRILKSGSIVRYLSRPDPDELERWKGGEDGTI